MSDSFPSGIININKPAGFTSFDVVAKLRGMLGIKKIGHTGTLDPDATGVLVICVGKATSLVESLSKHDKTYEATMLLGKVTDTQDISGKVLSESAALPKEPGVYEAIKPFIGEILQTPPMFSAKKVDGKRLYELAREGKEVERKPVKIQIFSIDITAVNLPKVKLLISCSSGTYIRTLIHDIGATLGCGACMSSLNRTKVGDYLLENSHSFADIEDMIKEGDKSFITPVESFFLDLKSLKTSGAAKRLVENGTMIPTDLLKHPSPGRYRIYHPDGRFAGVYQVDEKFARVEKMFLE